MTRISARRLGSYHPGASAKISATCNPSGQTAKQIADLGAPAPCGRNAGAAPARCGRSEDKARSAAVPALVRLLQDSDLQAEKKPAHSSRTAFFLAATAAVSAGFGTKWGPPLQPPS